MPFLKVGALALLPPGTVTEVQHEGNAYALANVNGELFCVDGLCPHAGGPLGEGTLNGSMLVCPWHGWEFDCRTGANDFDEDLKLASFSVIVDNDQISIDLP